MKIENYANSVYLLAGTTGTNYSNVTMLSATSLLHNSMIFNRNNTVATQQGMKTYWLWWFELWYCILLLHTKTSNRPLLIHVSRSYRLTTCRARCITAQGRIVSTTGQHNHAPHVRNSSTSAPAAAKPDLAAEQQQTGFMQPQQQQPPQPMTNQNSNMPMASATPSGMMNQHQMSANINFGAPSTSTTSAGDENVSANINFSSLSNILNSVAQFSDIEASTLLHSNQLNSDVQISPVTIGTTAANSSINNMQMHHQPNQNVHVAVGSSSFTLAVATTNNWFSLV